MRTNALGMGAVIAVCAICVQGATKIWTGSGADAKFSTDGNWEDMVAPVNGDTLVFQGENAVAENDFDSTVQFAAIYMSNSVPFTIRGNTLYLSGSRIFAKTLSTTITDRFEADVVSPAVPISGRRTSTGTTSLLEERSQARQGGPCRLPLKPETSSPLRAW